MKCEANPKCLLIGDITCPQMMGPEIDSNLFNTDSAAVDIFG